MILLVRRVLIPATAMVTQCKLTGEMLSTEIFFWFLPTSSSTLAQPTIYTESHLFIIISYFNT